MNNILTIDVEDYFMVSAFEKYVKYQNWGDYESRVVNNTRIILSILKKYNAKATFFVLGWVAQRYPVLVREIYDEGHEVASHGYSHRLVYNQNQEEFRADIRKAKEILEQIIGEPVWGYRAPSYSVTKNNKWAFEVLSEEGFLYDSSILPAYHARGGMPDAYRYPSRMEIKKKSIIEIPLSIWKIFGLNIPISGGGYFRAFPYFLIHKSIRGINAQNQPFVFYLHPWEIDPYQPKIPVRGINRFRHYLNLDKTENKFRRLLSSFDFLSIKEYINLNSRII